MAKRKTPSASGAEHARRAGLVSVQLLVSREERALIRAAAGAGDLPMSAYARRAVVERARADTGQK